MQGPKTDRSLADLLPLHCVSELPDDGSQLPDNAVHVAAGHNLTEQVSPAHSSPSSSTSPPRAELKQESDILLCQLGDLLLVLIREECCHLQTTWAGN